MPNDARKETFLCAIGLKNYWCGNDIYADGIPNLAGSTHYEAATYEAGVCTCNALGVEYPRIGWRAESEMAAVLRKKNQTASLSGKVLQI